MKDRTYNNADSFAISFDEEWQKVNCNDINQKLNKVIDNLSDHPFVISNFDNARKILQDLEYFLLKSLSNSKFFENSF